MNTVKSLIIRKFLFQEQRDVRDNTRQGLRGGADEVLRKPDQ